MLFELITYAILIMGCCFPDELVRDLDEEYKKMDPKEAQKHW
jgi:hypothetical protein